MTVLERDILNILTEDARISHKKIAAILSVTEEEVEAAVTALENEGILVKYTAIVNSEKADDMLVEALIEVKVTPNKKDGFDGIAKQIASFPEVKAVYLMTAEQKKALRLQLLRTPAAPNSLLSCLCQQESLADILLRT